MLSKPHIKKYQNQLVKSLLRFQLKNKEVTIISNNCWGAEVYKEFGLPYQTPFVGLFLFAPCYTQLLKNPRTWLGKKLEFVTHSKYQAANKAREQGIWDFYPIGILDDEIEIHFMHYTSEVEANEKWVRRTQRINWENENQIFFKFCDHGDCEKQFIEEFDKLQYSQKVCFTGKDYPDLKSTVWIKECQNEGFVVDGRKLYSICKKYFDVADWLNGGNGQLKFPKKILNQLLYEPYKI